LFNISANYGIKKRQLICELSNKGHSMDNLNKILDSFSVKSKAKPSSNKKRKWREIELLREKFQLEKDLRVYEDSLEYMLDEF